MKPKLFRITTVPESLKILLKGQHKFFSNNGYNVIGVSSGGVLLQEVKHDEGIKVFEIEMTRNITPFKDLKSLILLYILIKKESPIIVHTHTPKAGTVGMLAAKFARVPIRLHTVAGLPLLEESGLKRMLLNFVEKVTYACATKVYPNSNELRKIIEKNRFCIEAKLKVIAEGSSNGIDTNYFDPNLFDSDNILKFKSSLNIHPNDFIFIFIGRLVKDKGINELVKAFDYFQRSNLHCKLILVGNYEDQLDPLQNETRLIIEKNPNILALGFHSDVRPFLSISNCFVFPSYREGFPNVVLQAGAMGLPCIVTNINGCNEIIIEGVNGTIIPVKNIDGIIEKMTKLLVDKSFYSTLKKNSREYIVNRYEQKIVWKSLLQEYKFFESQL